MGDQPRVEDRVDIRVGAQRLWPRQERGRFPDVKALTQAVRDAVARGKILARAYGRVVSSKQVIDTASASK